MGNVSVGSSPTLATMVKVIESGNELDITLQVGSNGQVDGFFKVPASWYSEFVMVFVGFEPDEKAGECFEHLTSKVKSRGNCVKHRLRRHITSLHSLKLGFFPDLAKHYVRIRLVKVPVPKELV